MAFDKATAQVNGVITTIYTATTAGENIFSMGLSCDVDSNVYLYRQNGSTLTPIAFVRLNLGVPYKYPHKIILGANESLRARAMDRMNTDWQTMPNWQTSPNWQNTEESMPLEANVQIDVSILK